jgi:hypothetical protein
MIVTRVLSDADPQSSADSIGDTLSTYCALHLHDYRFILENKKEFVTSVRPDSNGGGLLARGGR